MATAVVVDADPQERARIAAALAQAGHAVQECRGARAALQALAPRAPDLLVVALDLPDGGGLDLVARVRTLHARPFPVVVVSADPADAARGRAVGATAHALRPLDPDPLARLVERLLDEEPVGLDLPGAAEGLAFGRYAVWRALGRGSFGVVYEAWDALRGEPVALKVLAPEAAEPEDLARFVRESRVLARVDDPHVVAMRDAGVVGGRAYCAMRLVHGPTLERHLRDAGPLAPAAGLALLRGLLRALGALAARGLVHRDLTPRNVILEGACPARPVVIDFGLAKPALDQGLTAPDVILGTPGFMAPEVIAGAEADARSDLYVAGVVALQALAGRHPFDGLRGMALLQAMAEVPPAIPLHLGAGARALLAWLTAVDPARRPATPAEALEALDQAAAEAGGSPPAPPPTDLAADDSPTVRYVRATRRPVAGA